MASFNILMKMFNYKFDVYHKHLLLRAQYKVHLADNIQEIN